MQLRGYYGYKKEGVNIETVYTLEYTCDQKVFDSIGTVKFDDSKLTKKEFPYLEDAVQLWHALISDERCLYLMLWEQIKLNGEIVLEQCRDMVIHSFRGTRDQKRAEKAERIAEELNAENERLKAYLRRYNVDVNKVLN